MTAWDVSAGGYRLVVEDGAIRGLAYDEWPWPWGDPHYEDVTEDCDGWLADLVYDRTVKIMPAPGRQGHLRGITGCCCCLSGTVSLAAYIYARRRVEQLGSSLRS